MRPSFLRACFAALVGLTLVSCEGETGPAGPPGDDGNANVRTVQFTVASAAWKNTSSASVAYYTYVSPLITSSVIQGGTVLLYYQFSSNVWTPLPDDFVTQNGTPYSLKYVHGLNGGVGAVEVYLISTSAVRFDAIFKAVIVDGRLEMSKRDGRNR